MVNPSHISNEIKPDIEAIEENIDLYLEANFDLRVEAVNFLEFNVIDRIEGLLQIQNPPGDLIFLKQYAERVKCQLEAVDDALFQRLRPTIQMGQITGLAFKDLIAQYTRIESGNANLLAEVGYDNLDIFINGLLFNKNLPMPTLEIEPEMFYYQQTPARIIFELIEKAGMTEEDVFYDLGSGLGHVPILVNLISGSMARGVEYEPAYCDYARECAIDLNLSRVEFINTDARTIDFSEGTVFFMYTPFVGKILQEVLDKLHRESRQRGIRLFTYGHCTPHVARQSWLRSEAKNGHNINRLGMFSSL